MSLPLERRAMHPRPFRIDRVMRECPDTVTLALSPTQGSERPSFLPGQFNMLYVFGVGEVPISISGDPTREGPLMHTVRAVGPVSRALAGLKAGAVVGVRGPFGSAWPTAEMEGCDVVVVAGGLGLAPLRPAILDILANRGHYGRFVILYGARTPRDILFRADLERWSARLDTYVDATVDRAASGWHGNVGLVTKLIARTALEREQSAAMVCGPETMIRFAIRALEDRGLAADRIHVSMERNMKCAVGFCGHCQFGGSFVCRDGPVFRLDRIGHVFDVREL